MSEEQPLAEFTSHIEGKNAKVRIFADHLEWEKPRGISRAKITTAVLTAGLSVAAMGVKSGKSGWEVLPIRSIASVSAHRDGLVNSLVKVTSAGGEVAFRVSHKEAATIRETIVGLINAAHAPAPAAAPAAPAPVAVPPAQPAPAPAAGGHSLAELAQLHAQGVLTDEEFAAAKARALGI